MSFGKIFKRNIVYFACALVGILHFICLALTYANHSVSTIIDYSNVGDGTGTGSSSLLKYSISGFNTFDLYNYGVGGTLASLLQIVAMFWGLCILAYGICGVLKAFGLFNKFPDSVGRAETKKLGELALFIFVGLQLLILLCLFVFCRENYNLFENFTEKKETTYTLSYGLIVFIALIVAAIIIIKALNKKFVLPEEDAPIVVYQCEICQRPATENDKLCKACGNSIIRVELPPEKKKTIEEKFRELENGDDDDLTNDDTFDGERDI